MISILETYCTNIYNSVRSIGGPIIGNLLTPLLFGKILYTPKNNASMSLMENVMILS